MVKREPSGMCQRAGICLADEGVEVLHGLDTHLVLPGDADRSDGDLGAVDGG